jgi:hypothetical protein
VAKREKARSRLLGKLNTDPSRTPAPAPGHCQGRWKLISGSKQPIPSVKWSLSAMNFESLSP